MSSKILSKKIEISSPYFPLLCQSPPHCSPTSLWESHDVFYVQPEPSCSPNNPLWFTSTPLEQQVLESHLTRVLLVSDINKDKKHLENQNKEEEGAGEAVGEE